MKKVAILVPFFLSLDPAVAGPVAPARQPVAIDYVKVCDSQGEGFFHIPGSDTCLSIGGYVRFDAMTGRTSTGMQNFNDPTVWTGGVESAHEGAFIGNRRSMNSLLTATQASISFDARSQSEFGLLRSYAEIHYTLASQAKPATEIEMEKGFIQWGGLIAGHSQSYFDFFRGFDDPVFFAPSVSNRTTNLVAYTTTLSPGISATLSLEDGISRRADNGSDEYADAQKRPDVVGNIRIDQAWGSAQLMAAYHQNWGAQQSSVVGTGPWQKDGYAVGAGLMARLPSLGKGDKIWAQVAYAVGAVDYTGADPYWQSDFADRSNTGLFQRRDTSAAVGFHHGFSAQYGLNLMASYHVSNGWVWRNTFTGPNAVFGTNSADYRQLDLQASLDWQPRVDNLLVRIGAEYRRVDYANDYNYFNRRPTTVKRAFDDGLIGYLRVVRSFGAGDDD